MIDDRRRGGGRPQSRSFVARLIHSHKKEWMLVTLAVVAVSTVVVNALFLQTGPHPAPMFANRPAVQAPAKDNSMVVPRPRPAEKKAEQKAEALVPAPMPTRTRAETIADIQRELAARGFYYGQPDGVYTAKTDIAIRDF